MGDTFTGVEKMLLKNSASPFLQKLKNSITHRRNSNYNAGQEIRPGPLEYRDVREQKYISLRHASTEFIRVVTGEGGLGGQLLFRSKNSNIIFIFLYFWLRISSKNNLVVIQL